MTKISLIFPTYNEQDNLEELYNQLVRLSNKLSEFEFEFLFIDDCSTDETEKIITRLRQSDSRVHSIRFIRNSGSHHATSAGISFCTGDIAIILAADLQDPPEIVTELIQEWRKGNIIVWGIRREREGEKFLTKTMSRFYYFLMNLLTSVRQPPSGADVVLIDRIVIEYFKKSYEKNSSVIMLLSWFGFDHAKVYYSKQTRFSGHSKWTFSKKIKLFFDSLISFSYIPIRLMSIIGILFASLGFIYGFIIIIKSLFWGTAVVGWASLMVVISLLCGFQMIMMGFLGEYLWRTFDEVRKRPTYIIGKNTYCQDDKSSYKM